MHLLAETAPATEVTPAIMGMAVIILLQLSQFFFAWRKDMRQNDQVRKEDLTELRNELMDEIGDVSDDLREMKRSVEGKMETARVESRAARKDIYEKIEDSGRKIEAIGLKTAALTEGQETAKQTLLALGNKVDAIRLSTTSRRP